MEKLIKYTNFDDDEDSFDDDGEEADDEFIDKIPNQNEDEAAQDELLESIRASFGNKLKRRDELRSEAGQKVSEFQVIPNDDDRAIPGFRGVSNLKKDKKAKRKKDSKTKSKKQVAEEELMEELDYDDPTMTKPMVEKAKRSALYENAKKDVSKWNSVVYHNRVSDQLVFPLNNGEKISKRSIKDTVADFVPRTPLEEEMAKILYGEAYIKKKKDEIHGKNEDDKTEEESYMLSVEEALVKHSELARLRAIQSYEMAKAKRRNKIKSKRYHRILRREKIKKQLKEFEEMKQKDPEGALEKLKELDDARIKERMTLKHRNTSKWAKSQSARAKYNKDSRIALSEQLKISKELTEKQMDSSEDDSDDDDDDEGLGMEFMDEPTNKKKDPYEIQDLKVDSTEENVETVSGKSSTVSKSYDLVSVRNNTNTARGANVKPLPVLLCPNDYLVITNSSVPKRKSTTKNITIDKEFLQNDDDEQDDDDTDQRMVIAEAFEDDDVVADFRKQKQDELDAAKPKDIDLTLPGWDAWGGTGITVSRKKRRKFVLKAPPPPPRKDAKLPHVILNDDANQKLREYQVRQVPFPFKRVKDFERSMRAPVGRTWLPEKAMKTLTAPKVITKLGSIIKPISEDFLVKNKHVTEKGSIKLLGGVKMLK